MVKLEEKDKYFGITESGVAVVPFVHCSKESAIEEWTYFERLNATGRQFLDHIRTKEEIEEIVSGLKRQNYGGN